MELAGVENTKRQDVAVYDLKLSNGALADFQWAFNKLAGTPTRRPTYRGWTRTADGHRLIASWHSDVPTKEIAFTARSDHLHALNDDRARLLRQHRRHRHLLCSRFFWSPIIV